MTVKTDEDAEITIDEELQQDDSKDEILDAYSYSYNYYNQMMALKKMKAKQKYLGARERQCDSCAYTTKNSSNLRRHQLTHRE